MTKREVCEKCAEWKKRKDVLLTNKTDLMLISKKNTYVLGRTGGIFWWHGQEDVVVCRCLCLYKLELELADD